MILICTLMSIVAAIYVAFGRSLLANSIWSVSNIGFIWHSISIAEYEMTLLFVSYEIIALYGMYHLGVKPYREKRNGNTT